ncbi:MAG: 50S ribosomal protein L17 [Bacteroidales bacterium]
MRHNKKFNHLGRKSAHRKAMLANMATSLILHKRIETTVAKAKALKIYLEPLITKSKNDTTHSRRVVFSYLQDKYAVTELFREVSVKIAERPGGYTRILKLGNRLGDNADMCIIELVDYNEGMLKSTTKGGAKKTRRRRGGATKTNKLEVEAQENQAGDSAVEQTVAKVTTSSKKAVDKEVAKAEKPKTEKSSAKKETDESGE